MTGNEKTIVEPRPTATIEDYLILMYVLERDGEDIVAARLAEALEVSPPTVTITLRRMERDGLLVNESRKGIHLTEGGRTAARSVIRRHMLTEWVLVDMLGVSWSKIHSEAHRIEHTISDEIEARMRDNLNDPHFCPHGNPMPGYEHLTTDWIALPEMPVGGSGIMRRIHEMAEDQPELMGFLESQGIAPGSMLKVLQVLPFNQTVTVQVAGREVSLGMGVAKYLYLEIPAVPSLQE